MTDDRLLTPAEVAERLQVAPHVVKQMRNRGDGPPFLRLGHKTVRYQASAVDAWLASR